MIGRVVPFAQTGQHGKILSIPVSAREGGGVHELIRDF